MFSLAEESKKTCQECQAAGINNEPDRFHRNAKSKSLSAANPTGLKLHVLLNSQFLTPTSPKVLGLILYKFPLKNSSSVEQGLSLPEHPLHNPSTPSPAGTQTPTFRSQSSFVWPLPYSGKQKAEYKARLAAVSGGSNLGFTSRRWYKLTHLKKGQSSGSLNQS